MSEIVLESDVVYIDYQRPDSSDQDAVYFTWGREEDAPSKSGDLLLASMVTKPEQVAWETPEGWKMVAEHNGGSGEDLANRKGNTKVSVFVKELENDGELANYAVTFTNDGVQYNDPDFDISSSSGMLNLLRKPKDAKWDYSQFVYGEDKVHNTSYFVNCPEILPLKNKDMLVFVCGFDCADANLEEAFDDGDGTIFVGDNQYAAYKSSGDGTSLGFDCGMGITLSSILNPDETGGNPKFNCPGPMSNGRSVCGPMICLRLRSIPAPPPPPRRGRSSVVPLDPKPPERLLMRTSPPYDAPISNPPTSTCNCGLWSVYVGSASDTLGIVHRCYGCRRPVAGCICG